MQPYFFPYLGYFQLLSAVDELVVQDAVTFIKGGWINRNRILSNGSASLFTVPLAKHPASARIREVEVDGAGRSRWQRKLLARLDAAYRTAPFFREVRPLVEDVVMAPAERIGALAEKSVRSVAAHLGIATRIDSSSAGDGAVALKGQERVLDLCREKGASSYLNLPGGRTLYSAETFRASGIALRFIAPRRIEYPQLGAPFVSDLSIIDVLMFNSRDRARELLSEFDLE